eukprot:CAMPEP_0177759458 /NCGR_PEP_ID=MMETSP0491_2-20121128/4745_1 /TAXON_ID=63592 /ORGANISM="Tetraselmis chuii, Strain PLY429" /LENGTH=439 /DNA_ID=CAMNT_0019275293 /DNA_START=450 /DNA_END=1769 /DNA_ORIENTATION=+
MASRALQHLAVSGCRALGASGAARGTRASAALFEALQDGFGARQGGSAAGGAVAPAWQRQQRTGFAASAEDIIWNNGIDRKLIDAEEPYEIDEEAEAQELPYYVSMKYCSQLSSEDVNKYWQMLPLHEEWPKGLRDEFEMSGTTFSMYRESTHELFAEIETSFATLKRAMLGEGGSAAQGAPVPERRTHFLLQGTQGSGKSVTLAAAAEFSRLCGAVVVYVPSCLELVDGGMYHKNEEVGGWDTPDHARRLISNLLDTHGHRLESAPNPNGEGTIKSVAEAGLSRNINSVDAALELIDCLRQTTAFPVVFALDDYNALYSHTAYYEAVTFKKRRMIMPGELRLANKLRMLEHEPIRNGICIAAPTYSSCISPALKIPYQRSAIFEVPTLNEMELDRMSEFYADYDAIPERPDGAKLLQMNALTAGNGKEFRKRVALSSF